mmetsp:Transcript_10394/g.17215  ORF Transcript_10394/g.17215 Transcript_10394/m.17215 type:complete len:229 (-) Transcript_10394:888-1574(-)
MSIESLPENDVDSNGRKSIQLISRSRVTLLTLRRFGLEFLLSTTKYTSVPPRSATTIWPLSFEDATVIKPIGSSSSLSSSSPLNGDQSVIISSVAESTTRTPSSTTCTSKSAPPTDTFPANKVDLDELNPPIVTSASAPPSSSSSSSSISVEPSISRSLELCTPNILVSLTKLCTKNVSSCSSKPRLKLHMPLIPSISTSACSFIPTPLRTNRTVPSLATPEQVTTTD